MYTGIMDQDCGADEFSRGTEGLGPQRADYVRSLTAVPLESSTLDQIRGGHGLMRLVAHTRLGGRIRNSVICALMEFRVEMIATGDFKVGFRRV